MQSQILGIETDITRWQQRQNSKNNFTANVPYELEQLRNETREFLDDLTVRDQRMMFAVVTLVHVADTLKQLDADTETLLSIGRGALMPVCGTAVSAGGWIEYSAALWPAPGEIPADADHGEHRRAHALPCPGDPGSRRSVLWCERCK